MTTEEIEELSRLEEVYRVKSYNQTNYDDTVLIVRNTKAAAVIDFIRKDLKKIVADAVKEAVGTLNSDKKPVHPDESALDDLDETLYGKCKEKEFFPIDLSGGHPIASTSYEGRNKYRYKLLRMGITHYEEIHGYLTDSPIAAPYSLLVNDKWLECPRDFTAYDFAGLSEDMKLLGFDFQSSPMKALDDAWKKREATESKRHLIDDVKFTYSDTLELLDSFGVKYLDEIKGYRYGLDKHITEIYIFNQTRFIPEKNFADLKAVMMSYFVPFLQMDIRNGETKEEECGNHRINKIKFRLDDTIPFLEKMGVKYLEDIKGYKKLFSDKYKPTYPWCESLFYLNVNGNLVECPEGFTILSLNDILNAMEENGIQFPDLTQEC